MILFLPLKLINYSLPGIFNYFDQAAFGNAEKYGYTASVSEV